MGEGGLFQPLRREASAGEVGRRRRALGALAFAAVVLTVFTGCAYPDSSRPACADRVLDDWTKGTLDSVYPLDCYGAAIDALPEDLRAYTTAADDISRAAFAANRASVSVTEEREASAARQLAESPVQSDGLRVVPLQVVLLAVIVTVLAASGLAAAAIRRRRPR